MVLEGNNEWRKSVGAPQSKSVYERLRKDKEAAEMGSKDDASLHWKVNP